jgi:hypothetical protein
VEGGEAASASAYEIEHGADGRFVSADEQYAVGPFASNAEAWSWIDRHTMARRYGVSNE